MKSIRIIILTIGIGIGIGIVMALAIAGVVLPRPIWGTHADGEVRHRILVLSNPIHTDIAIPVDDVLRTRFGFIGDAGLDLGLDGVRYVIFGWGGRAFYTQTPTWADLKTVPVLKSLTLDRSVMHVELAGDIAADSPYATAITVDDIGFERLLSALRQSFVDNAAGPIVLKGYAYGPYDAFFEANGYFNAIAGCNTWTAAMLRQAGLRTGWWTPLPWTLRMALRLHNAAGIVAR